VKLWEAVEKHGRKTALVDAASGSRISYDELATRTATLASLLEAEGVSAGDRVAVLANGSVRTFELLVACSRLGAILVPLNTRLAEPELANVFGIAEPSVLFADEAHASRARAIGAEPSALYGAPKRLPAAVNTLARCLDPTGATNSSANCLPAEPNTSPNCLPRPVVLLFTSGTTGRAKGALLTEGGIAANASSTARAWGVCADDVGLVDAPLFHTGGLNVLATPLLFAGGTVVVAPRFDADASAELLVRERCTLAFGVPQMLERLAATVVLARGAVRLFVTGGAPCPRALHDAYSMQNARIVQGFGMTECGPNCFRPIEGQVASSVGVPTFDLEARLDDDGELLLRGPHVFAGYFRDDAATRAALDDDGWLRTGDVLRRDDARGWRVVGRCKEMFISGGENVYPAEVEIAIAEHPSVREVAVVAATDPRWGESGVAFVIPNGAPPSDAELRAFVRARLAGYKVPRAFVVADELPRTASGKIDKRSLRASL
jgi:fatty-acyl-CoA synthase